MGTSGIVVEPAAGRTVRGGASAGAGEREEGLDLFLRRRSATVVRSLGDGNIHNGSIKNLSVGSAIKGTARADDFLDAEMGKHDYDWLLTPPGTPIFPSSDSTENQQTSTGTKNPSIVKSVSTSRASRVSASQSDNGHSARPTRSSSVNRSSASGAHSNSLINHRTSALNSSTVSVTSRPTTPSRPSTPGNHSVSVLSTKASAVSRSVQARSTNPSKSRPNLTTPGEKIRPLQKSRPSTPNGRHQHSSVSGTNINSSVIRSTSRPSTPTHRPNTPGISSSAATIAGRSPSAGRLPSIRNSVTFSRPSSPGVRPRAPPVMPIDIPDFPHETPPNLRTKLPERPTSAGRIRPGMALIARASSNTETPATVGSGRRQSMSVTRSKLPESTMKVQSTKNYPDTELLAIQKPIAPDPGVRRASKISLTESTGFGRTLSKMSLDMALRHMDIRQNMGGIRANSLFPHSIRSGNAPKSRPTRGTEPIAPATNNEPLSEVHIYNRNVSENGDFAFKQMNKDCLVAKESDFDIRGSSRYDAMLLKEDLKNTNWLHSVEDKSDQSPVFDHRFEPPPEPFGPL
ncbi:probable serine/threonine-protein kinase roco5 [Phalaenopsis equestris]|uniref:probable serine/threonine-protein kinase roco5 n=1 Tax=Phalaenopsis equestris TaxID=78828 RepID=UPI0009E2017A|nr:probable serine/threonine-protein kinase roco5 [Phalaenopsis equestris]